MADIPNKPITRKEAYLAAIGGQDVDVPAKPITREEAYLAAILNNGLGAKNLEDLDDVLIVDPVNGYVVKFDAELGKWVAGPASGSGGTSDYTDLSNKPQINGNTLAGDKSAEDLGLAGAGDIPTKVSDLDNDEDFISDADYVHTDNNYDDNAKGIVDGVTEALAGKQDTLTFDNIPTENSTNPVKSGGVYSADEAIRKWTTAEAKSVSGNPITLTDGSARKAEALSVTCEPKQNLHGYDHPWAGGAGKNKLPMTVANLKAINTNGTWSGNSYADSGITYEVQTDTDGNVTGIKVNGTASASSQINLAKSSVLSLDGSYILSGSPSGSMANGYRTQIFCGTDGDVKKDVGSGVAFSSADITADNWNIVIIISNGTTVSNQMFYPMIRLSTVSDASFEPYTNECPISGYDECVVTVKDEEETTQDTATITFGQTVYGGSVDFKTGKVTVTHASIASYNGETINEPWLSSMDEYVSGTTPTTGAQVVYPLTTPIELTLTPAELELLKGYNYISTNGTTISLDYLPDSLLAEAENYVDDADSVLNAKIDEIDGRVDSIEAMSYHTDGNGTKTVTLTNVYQQVFVSISILDTRTIYLVVQQKANGTVVETIFSTAGKTPVDIAVTHATDDSFTITLPRYAQTNIISTEPFSVE